MHTNSCFFVYLFSAFKIMSPFLRTAQFSDLSTAQCDFSALKLKGKVISEDLLLSGCYFFVKSQKNHHC